MLDKLNRVLRNNFVNFLGWKTNRKIVVIESDDWGSIRMASKEAYLNLLKEGYPVDQNPYNRFDALESDNDVEILLNTLSSVKDKNGNPAILTLNNVVANPDFEKIKENGFKRYFYETFDKTLKRYPAHGQVMLLYHEGIAKRLIRPQFHGREHLNLSRWMRDLQIGNKAILDAFDHEMYSIHAEKNPIYKNEYMDALDFESNDQIPEQLKTLKDGFNIFENLWGYQSNSFIANCYIWHPKHEVVLKELGVNYLQGIPNQFVPIPELGYRYRRRFHYQGQKNSIGQRYLVRNAFFEPYQKPGFDWVNDCLKRIEIAFEWNKPAIISSHRINFIGFLDQGFRDRNIKKFEELLKSIIKKWPEVEFISSDELGKLMNSN